MQGSKYHEGGELSLALDPIFNYFSPIGVFEDSQNYVLAPTPPILARPLSQPSSLTSGPLQPTSLPQHHNSTASSSAQPLRHVCPFPQCMKSYNRKGDLTRHVTTAHQRPVSYLCHVYRCPRGIPGNGFARKDKLVDHLTTKKHGLSKVDALYEATLHNAGGCAGMSG